MSHFSIKYQPNINSKKIREIKYYITLLVAFVISHMAFSQTYNFEYYTAQEGLSQSKVTDIIQDSKGYIWIGTFSGGVCKFDGTTFTQYSEKEGVSGNITSLSEDLKGNIWLTSMWTGVTKYNGRNFFTFTEKDNPLTQYEYNTVFTDKKGTVWIGSDLGIVTYKDNITKRYTKENSQLIGNVINEINEDSKGNIWVGTNEGITIFRAKDIVNISSKEGLPSDNIIAIIEGPDENYYIGTDKGVVKLLAENMTSGEFKFDQNLFKSITFSITDLLFDEKKELWITTKDNGIYLLNNSNSLAHITKKNGLLTNSLTKLFLDRSGNMWIGTNGSGLIKYANKAFLNYTDIKGLNSPRIFSIVADDKNYIWVSTSDDGVYKYKDGISTQYTTKNGLGSNTVRSSVFDKKGNLWFATNNGLTRYKNGVFKNFTTKDGLASNDTRVLLLDKSENLWIGTYGGGLSKYDYTTFENFTIEDGLSYDYIHTLFEDSKENIWIGSVNGISKYSEGKFTSLDKKEEICGTYIGCIAEDKYGNIWFGSNKCVVRYDGSNFKAITTQDGLSSEYIYLIHNDSKGNLWIGTNNGLDKISFDNDGQINKIKNYRSNQGFKGIECNSRAIFEDKKNNLWIGTVKGLIKYNPHQDKSNIHEPLIHINDLKLFFKDVNWLNYSEDLTKSNNLPNKLVLGYDENHLTFEFTAINLTLPEDVQYQFMLEPFDDQWFGPTNETSATYSNLPPGKYTFNVKARNEDGLWNKNPVTYSFKIASPWWKKWWFIFGLTILFLYIIYKIASFKEQQHLKISKQLEEKVTERTTLIKSQRDEKEILLKEIHHRVKNNMQIIISLLSIQSNYTKDEAALVLFDEAKNRIRSMALIHEKMYQTGDLAHIDIQDYIIGLTNDLIDTYSINCDISLDIKIEKVKFGIDTLIPFGLLINEVISNTLKYAFINSAEGKMIIHFKLNEKENTYALLIGDNGIGMPMGTLDKEEDSSLGMELIKIFVTQLDGSIKRLEKKGTFFEIKFKHRN